MISLDRLLPYRCFVHIKNACNNCLRFTPRISDIFKGPMFNIDMGHSDIGAISATSKL